jgi:hypothetical protein
MDLPITVNNSGGSVSDPVASTLTLPEGVTAVATQRLAGPPLLRLNAAKQGTIVSCPGGTGTVTCASGRGLQPGESMTLLFRLIADENSPGGEITGTVTAGTVIRVNISVRVDVQPLRDGVSVHAFPDWLGLGVPGRDRAPSVGVIAKNIGESTKQVTVTFDEGATLKSSWPAATCTTNGATTSCVTDERVKPGERFYLRVRLRDRGNEETDRGGDWHSRKVHVTATIGTASASTVVKFPWWRWPIPDPEPPTTKPSVPTTTTTTTTKPTGKPSNPATEPTKPTSSEPASSPPPPVVTTPPTRSTTQPPPDPCAGMSEVERLLATLTGRCPTPAGPGPR